MGLRNHGFTSASGFCLQTLPVKKSDTLPVHPHQPGICEGAQRAAYHIPHRTQLGSNLLLRPASNGNIRGHPSLLRAFEQEPGEAPADRAQGQVLDQIRQVIQTAGEIPQDRQCQPRALADQSAEVIAGNDMEGDTSQSVHTGVVHTARLKWRHSVERLSRPKHRQYLLATARREAVDTHLALGDEVGSLAGITLKDDHLTGLAGAGESGVGNTSQFIRREVGEQRDAAQKPGRGGHSGIIVSQSLTESRRVRAHVATDL